jgi:uncharacterized membrane protein YqgA involved in biofilm formation
MSGTLLNVAAILIGSAAGMWFGARLSENLKHTVIAGMGLFTCAVGLQMFLKTENALIVLGALILGAMLGEWWGLEDGLQKLGAWLEKRFLGAKGASGQAGDGNESGAQGAFARAFLTTTVLYCTGPMAVLGSISDGLNGDSMTLTIKSVLDGINSLAFASTLGVGVAFSALPVLIYQGSISLLAAQLDAIVSASMMNEMTATGGVLLLGIGISSSLEIKKIRVGNFLPALVIAPVLVYVVSLVLR